MVLRVGDLRMRGLRFLVRSLVLPRVIPKILRYSFIVLVFLTNRKDYEHFINVRVF
jgi:hypothetical protein